MNIWAVAFTFDYKEARSLSEIKEYVPMPTSNVNLKLNNGYIISNYASVMKKAYHSV